MALSRITAEHPLVLVGCGRMGGAMLAGWLAEGVPPGAVIVVDPQAPTVPQGVAVVAEGGALADDLAPRVVVFAVKPQMMAAVAPAYARFCASETVFLSIAAGTTLAGFASFLGAGAAVVRAMPNTPAAIGRGVSGVVANPAVSAGMRDLCASLLGAVSTVLWLEHEDLLDAVTAVSGSGPAYVFALAECLAEAGVAVGLPEDLARQFARLTVEGAGELLAHSDQPAAALRQAVTSPGGTTQAALEVLLAEDGLAALMTRAVRAAAARARELAG